VSRYPLELFGIGLCIVLFRLQLLGAAMSLKTIHAKIQLLTTKEGGRSGVLLSGYRSLLRFEGTEGDFGFELELEPELRTNGLAPGESGNARLSFWAVDALPTMFPGLNIQIYEGTRLVGHGSITRTLDAPWS
jgi:translation elongation factor EF-Tu-like GTPase